MSSQVISEALQYLIIKALSQCPKIWTSQKVAVQQAKSQAWGYHDSIFAT